MQNHFPNHKIIFLALFVVFSLFQFLCDFKKPAAPSFESNVNVPLIAKTYFMSELVDETDYIKSAENGDLYFEIERKIKRFSVSENLKISTISKNLGLELGLFKIKSPETKSIYADVGDFSPDVSKYDGQIMVVTPFEMQPVRKSMTPFSNFNWVDIDSGAPEITLTNNFEFSIGSPLYLVLFAAGSNEEITRSVISRELAPGESETMEMDLSGKRLPSAIDILIYGQCLGSHAKLVKINAQNKVQIDVTLHDLIVLGASAKIPEQNVKNTNDLALDDSLIIQEALIENGIISIRFGGNLPLRSFLTYELADFYDQNNQTLKKSLQINPNSENFEEVDLQGYTFKPNYNGVKKQMMQFKWQYRTEDTGDNFVEVFSKDSLLSDIHLSKLQFESFKGIINALEVDIEPVHEEIDLPSELDSLLLADAEMELNISNSINFPATSHLTIKGRNEAAKEVPMLVNEKINAASQPGQIKLTTIIMNSGNSEIVPFMNSLPNQIEVLGNVILGENRWEGTVYKNDFIEGSLKMKTALAMALPRQTVETKVDEIKLDNGLRKKVEKHLLEGELLGFIENQLPIATKLTIMFGLIDSLVYDQPELLIGPIEMKPATYSLETGYSLQPATSDIKINLDSEELNIFKNDPLYIGLQIEIPGTAGHIVRIKLSDFMKIQLALKLKVLIGSTEDAEE